MQEIINYLSVHSSQGDQLSPLEVLFALGLSFVCVICVSYVYRFTHKGAGYSQSYVQSLVLMGLVTTLIMIVIGSNIARAFSLVGALSIIRFRNAIKETRDVAYIFFAMAISMGCGTRFFIESVIATVVISTVMLFMHFVDFGSHRRIPERLLKVQLPPGSDLDAVLEPVMRSLFESFSVVSIETIRQGLYVEAVFSVRPKLGVTVRQVLEAISAVNDNLKITYNYRTDSEIV
jgi:hypothetical protein